MLNYLATADTKIAEQRRFGPDRTSKSNSMQQSYLQSRLTNPPFNGRHVCGSAWAAGSTWNPSGPPYSVHRTLAHGTPAMLHPRLRSLLNCRNSPISTPGSRAGGELIPLQFSSLLRLRVKRGREPQPPTWKRAEGGSRTHTPVRALDFESRAKGRETRARKRTRCHSGSGPLTLDTGPFS